MKNSSYFDQYLLKIGAIFFFYNNHHLYLRINQSLFQVDILREKIDGSER